MYCYKPLQTLTSSRLLRLRPDRDRFSPTICCDIVPFDLIITPLPAYEALSYVWGSSEKPCRLEIADNGELAITQSLYDALRDLREDQPRMIWADAVCINQNDIQERNTQVVLMDRVYQNARKVITYIGAGTEERYTGFILAQHLCDFAAKTFPSPPDPRLRNREKLTELGLPHQKDPRWKHLQDVYKLPWSSRVWIVQESTLNENIIMQCGKLQLPFDMLGQLEILALRGLAPELAVPETSDSFGLASDFTGTHPSTLGTMSSLRKSAKQGFLQNETLQLLLQNTRYLSCTDPRDKVYALLNIAQDNGVLHIQPDYALPIEQVYEDAAARILQSAADLDLLSGIGPPKRFKLPSWAPDWTVNHNSMLEMTVAVKKGLYQASGESKSDCRYDRKNSSMIVNGGIFDRIKRTRGVIWPTKIQRNPAWIEDQIQIAAEMKAYGSLTKGREAFWRTLITNLCEPEGLQQPTEATDDYAAYFKAYSTLQNLLSQAEMGANVQIGQGEYGKAMAFQASMARASAHRSLCTTEKGYLAMAVEAVQEGDLVSVLAGGKVPYILREKEGSSSAEPRLYELVGDAYVHGIMKGEAASGDFEFGDITLV